MMGRHFDTYRKDMMSRVTDLSLCFHDTQRYFQPIFRCIETVDSNIQKAHSITSIISIHVSAPRLLVREEGKQRRHWDRITAGPATFSIILPFGESSEHCARCDTRAQHLLSKRFPIHWLGSKTITGLGQGCFLQAGVHPNAPSKCRTIQLDGLSLHLHRTYTIS